MKEWIRKKIVYVKRNTQIIPLIMLCVTCLVLNLNLTAYSDTIEQINEPRMGICLFVTALCSYLSIITYLLAFPKHQKQKTAMIIVVLVMLGLSIMCQIFLKDFIHYATVTRENPIEITEERLFITKTSKNIIVHIIFVVITFVMVVTMPLYKKLLQKIDTSIETDDVRIDKIDLTDE